MSCHNQEMATESHKHHEATTRYKFSFNLAQRLGEEAAQRIRNGSITIQTKDDGTPVTDIDTEINERFVEAVEREFGCDGDVVYGEESSLCDRTPPADRPFWLLDPFDGTGWLTRILANNEDPRTLRATTLVSYFSPSEATPTFGIIHSPYFGGVSQAASAFGEDSFHHPNGTLEERVPLTAPFSSVVDISDVTLYERNGATNPRQDVGLRRLKEIAPKGERVMLPLFLANVALDNAQIAMHPGPSHPHDIAAGALIAHNAGVTVKDFDGHSFGEIDWRREPLNGIVAGANKSLVESFLSHYP